MSALQDSQSHRVIRSAATAVAAGLLLANAADAQPLIWRSQGAGPNTEGQVENIDDREVEGAIKAVAVDPSNSTIVYVGSVNGGIWKTTNATAAKPNWQQLTDSEQSLSIGALAFDPTDGAHKTLVTGIGRFSSYHEGGALV